MDNNLKKKILDIAKYIIKNDATIDQAAKHFGCSKSTIQHYINDPDKLPSIDINIYDSVYNVQKIVCLKGNIKGGKAGLGVKRSKHTQEEIENLVCYMIENGLTYAEMSRKYNIPISTLHDMFKRIENKEICMGLANLASYNVTEGRRK